MRDIKEKPQKPKIKGNAFKERRPTAKVNTAGRMGRLMKGRYLRERDKGRQEQEPNAVISAEEQVEQTAEGAVSFVRSAAAKGFVKTRQTVQAKRQAAKQAAQDGQGAGHGDSPYREAAQPTTAPEYGKSQAASEQRQPPSPGERMKQAFLKEAGKPVAPLYARRADGKGRYGAGAGTARRVQPHIRQYSGQPAHRPEQATDGYQGTPPQQCPSHQDTADRSQAQNASRYSGGKYRRTYAKSGKNS